MTVLMQCPGSMSPTHVIEHQTDCPRCGMVCEVGIATGGDRVVMAHMRPDPQRGLPFVTTDEAGETAWAIGHVNAHLFVRALIRSARVCGWWIGDTDDELRKLLQTYSRDGMVRRVKHVWMWEHPDNEEMYLPSTPTTPRAEPFTCLDIG